MVQAGDSGANSGIHAIQKLGKEFTRTVVLRLEQASELPGGLVTHR